MAQITSDCTQANSLWVNKQCGNDVGRNAVIAKGRCVENRLAPRRAKCFFADSCAAILCKTWCDSLPSMCVWSGAKCVRA